MSCWSGNHDGCMTITVYSVKTGNPMGMQMTGSGHSHLQALCRGPQHLRLERSMAQYLADLSTYR